MAVLIQIQLSSYDPPAAQSLMQDTTQIFDKAYRIAKFLVNFAQKDDSLHPRTLISCVKIAASVNKKCWWNSHHFARQLEGIGIVNSRLLLKEGMISHDRLMAANASEIEHILRWKAPRGTALKAKIDSLPALALETRLSESSNQLNIIITVKNPDTAACSRWDDNWLVVVATKTKTLKSVVLKGRDILSSTVYTVAGPVLQKGDSVQVYLGSMSSIGLNKRVEFAMPSPDPPPITSPAKRVIGNLLDDSFDGGASDTDDLLGSIELPSAMEALLDAPIPAPNQLFRKCKHTCADRATCGHKCCLVGVKSGKAKFPKRAAPSSSSENVSASSGGGSSGGGDGGAAAAGSTSTSATKKKAKKVSKVPAPSSKKPSMIQQHQLQMKASIPGGLTSVSLKGSGPTSSTTPVPSTKGRPSSAPSVGGSMMESFKFQTRGGGGGGGGSSHEVLSDSDSEDERKDQALLLQASSYPACSQSAAAVAAGQHQQQQQHHHHQASSSTETSGSTKSVWSANSGSASRPQPLSQHGQRQSGPAWSNGFTAGTAASGVAPAKQQQQQQHYQYNQQYQQETQQQQTYSRSSFNTRDQPLPLAKRYQAVSSAPKFLDPGSSSSASHLSSGALVGRGSRVTPQPPAASYTSASGWNPETHFSKSANKYAGYQPTSMLPSTASAALSIGRQPPPQHHNGTFGTIGTTVSRQNKTANSQQNRNYQPAVAPSADRGYAQQRFQQHNAYGGGGGGGRNTQPQQQHYYAQSEPHSHQLQPSAEFDDLFGDIF